MAYSRLLSKSAKLRVELILDPQGSVDVSTLGDVAKDVL